MTSEPTALRPVLMPPVLDEERVHRLAQLAAMLDGNTSPECEQRVARFNREAGTRLQRRDFQGVYGATDHETFVRDLLSRTSVRRVDDITRAELVEMTRRVVECDGTEHETGFWLSMLEVNLGDARISDLIFWPGEYFGDGDDSRNLTPTEIVEIALDRTRERGGGGGRSDAGAVGPDA